MITITYFLNESMLYIKWFNVVLYFIYISVFLGLLTFVGGYFLRSMFYMLIAFFLLYWLVSIFLYLYKKAQYTTYTRILQRWWKRALALFWLIELYLFGTFLFLTLITPQEVMYLLDSIWSYYSFASNLKPFFVNIFCLVCIILGMNMLLLCRKYKTFYFGLVLLITVMLLFVLQADFLQLYYINQYYTNLTWVYDADSNIWELETATLKNRTYLHYLYLLIFLKFWHTLFIVGFFLFYENIFVKTNKSSYNIFSANLQNMFFLLGFGFILKLVLVKHYMNYLYEYIYYWFFINNHFYDLSYWYQISDIKYFLFIFQDLNLI